MANFVGGKRIALVALVVALAGPAMAQDNSAEARLRRIEAEVRALQTKVFPGGDGRFFPPQIAPGSTPAATTAGAPATTPVTDLLSRMDTVEAQLARLTAQGEVNANKLAQLEARVNALAPAATPTPAPTATPSASTPTPTSTPAATPTPRPTVTPTPAAATGPSAQRLAAVRAIVKPQTDDAGDDEYSYGFRLWEAKFYPEAQQQLKLFVDRYPRHARISYARNLLGRAYLDDAKPREAAQWFLQNYQAAKKTPPGPSERAPDSLLMLADAMNRLRDTSRACIALAEFGETYTAESAGRLASQYSALRNTVKCN